MWVIKWSNNDWNVTRILFNGVVNRIYDTRNRFFNRLFRLHHLWYYFSEVFERWHCFFHCLWLTSGTQTLSLKFYDDHTNETQFHVKFNKFISNFNWTVIYGAKSQLFLLCHMDWFFQQVSQVSASLAPDLWAALTVQRVLSTIYQWKMIIS